MTFLRWTLRLHKWIGLIIGLQIFLWILGGLVMSAMPIEIVRGEHKIAEAPPPAFDPAEMITLEAAAEAASLDTVDKAELVAIAGEPAWRLTSGEAITTISARSGARWSPFSEAAARAIAEADYAGPGKLAAMEQLEKAPTEYGGRLPVWRAVFDDDDNTTLYIEADTGRVAARRSSTWRLFDFFWKLHVMDYDDGADFNHPLLILAAAIATFVAGSGLVLLFIRMRRLLTGRKQGSAA